MALVGEDEIENCAILLSCGLSPALSLVLARPRLRLRLLFLSEGGRGQRHRGAVVSRAVQGQT